jgi:D-3-phosphoglycerate dehydrogenase
VFKRVIAADPYLIDGDFPAYVGRGTLDEVFAQADVVLAALRRSTPRTRGMIGPRERSAR